MRAPIEKNKHPTRHTYHEKDIDIALKFAKSVYKELPNITKGIIIFGSTARAKDSEKSDVDILIIIDDVTLKLSDELMKTYKVIVDKKIVEVSQRLHVVTLKFTTFWEYVRAGDPIAINILRDGVSLIDSGFFDPLQALLYQGRIRPTQESINSYYSKAPLTIYNSKWHLLQATMDLYWAAIDSAHAALMSHGCIPPSPQHVPEMLEQELVKKRHLEMKYVETMRLLFELFKKITHRELGYISGKDYDKYLDMTNDFVNRMRVFVR